jgi:hypothetical protein
MIDIIIHREKEGCLANDTPIGCRIENFVGAKYGNY